MRSMLLFLLTLFVILLGTLICNIQTPALHAFPSDQEVPLRLSEPLEAIVADLQDYIPEYMRKKSIPGVGIALIREGKVVWTESFGVKNSITDHKVTSDTIFGVASNSKVVTAYIALRLVDQGLLSLDKPLNAYLPEPWLPPSEYRDVISLRHVLSHSSGLRHFFNGENLFVPGSGYYYSGIGYQYLQAVIEQITDKTLEGVAQEMVFRKLNMPSSSFVTRAELEPRKACGHMRASVPVVLFLVFFTAFLIIIGLIGFMVLRLVTGGWQPIKKMVIGVISVALVLVFLLPFILLWEHFAFNLAWMILLSGLIVTVIFVFVFLVGRLLFLRLFPVQQKLRITSTLILSSIILLGITLPLSYTTNIPVPKSQVDKAAASGSMRATVGDMAAFLIELSNPQYLSVEIVKQLQKSQVKLSHDLSWGLGPGIYHSSQGDALWQWGSDFDFQSLMMMYPEPGIGVIVCTNTDQINMDVALEIAHRALGGQIESIRQAIHFKYSYRTEW